jgi:hypothetical protein
VRAGVWKREEGIWFEGRGRVVRERRYAFGVGKKACVVAMSDQETRAHTIYLVKLPHHSPREHGAFENAISQWLIRKDVLIPTNPLLKHSRYEFQ